jgi:tetratricopeptide (TPR) repeat protein
LQVQTDHRDLPVLLATDPAEAEELSAFSTLSRASFHNDWPTALAAAERLIAVRPDRESYWADAVQAASRTGDSAGAWARAQTALARFPEPGARLLVQAAAAARDAGASASAAPLIQAARAAMATGAVSDTRTQDTFRGLIAGLPRGADEAVAVARAHRANRPDDGWKTVDLAEALIEAGRYAEAVAVADEGLARWPDFHFIHANRAEALAKLGRMPEALAAAETAVSIYPRNPGILRYQSQVLDLAGRREHALGRLLMGLALHNRWRVQDEVLTLARRTGPHADGDAFTAARAVLADPETYGGLPRMFAGLQAVRIACERDQAWAGLPVIDAMTAIPGRPAAATAALAVLAAGIPAWQEPGRAPVPDLDVAWTLVQDAGAILAASRSVSASRSVTATAAARVADRCAAALRLAGDNAFIAGRARAYQAVAGGDATAALAALLTVGEGVEPEIAQVRRHLLDPAEPLLPLDYDPWDGWTVRRPIPDLGFDAAGIQALGELLVRRGATAALPAPTSGWRRIPDKQLTRHLGGVDRGWDFPPASWKARQAALAAAKAAAAATTAASASTAQRR